MDSLAETLGYIRRRGVRLWSENGQLRYKAPKGALSPEEIKGLREAKGEIVAFLERETGCVTVLPTHDPRRQSRRAPLAFSQLEYWHLHRLGERPTSRQLASVTWVRGILDVDVLHESLAEIVRRHEALRTRIVVVDGIPVQEIAAAGVCEFEVDDLTKLPEIAWEESVRRVSEQLMMQPIDVSSDPLLSVRLLRLGMNEYVLIVAMEHIISDAFSMNILLRELFTAYVQSLQGQVLSLPPVPVQLADYAAWQRNAHHSRLSKYGAHSDETLVGLERLRFPGDASSVVEATSGWGTIALQIGKDLKTELGEWCRVRKTSLVMSVFTAYAALVLRWCRATEGVIQFQTDGRDGPQIQNTIGYFATALYVRVELLEGDSLIDLMDRLTAQYCKAYECGADLAYMASKLPRPEVARNTVFNWVPQVSEMDLSAVGGAEGAMTSDLVPIANSGLKDLDCDNEPVTVLFDTEDGIVGRVSFPLNRFSAHMMERFGRHFLAMLRALLQQPESPVKDLVTF